MKSDETKKNNEQPISDFKHPLDDDGYLNPDDTSVQHHPGLVILARMITRRLNEGKTHGKDISDSTGDTED